VAEQLVRLEKVERVAIIRLERPPVNAINGELLEQLAAIVRSIHDDPAIGAATIVGGERAFAAGADIRELSSLADPQSARAWLERGQAVTRLIEAGPVPFVAAITGFCLGGGCEIALACHLRIAGESARLGQPEIKLGVIPGWGGTQRLTRLVGIGRSLEMLLTGEPVDAPSALAMGLVNAVVPDDEVLTHAQRLAAIIARFPATALRELLGAAVDGLDLPLTRGLDGEVEHFLALVGTDGMREGVAAFLEKRAPRFHG
jgi:enoyl-CoA hydratase/carnithine racemase